MASEIQTSAVPAALIEPQYARKPGSIVGERYRIDSYLGRGGMGEVYAATHLMTGAQVALKLLRREHALDETVCRRFLREARAATAIRHPNVIEVHDVFEDHDALPVMVMELLHGESLAQRLERVGTLQLSEAVPIFLCVAKALCAAHARGVVHRDLKPDNIFLLRDSANGEVAKVLDFGIAKILDSAELRVHTYGASTNHGGLLGTIPYMSYEQAMGETIDGRTDVWSFAVTMVEAISARRPLAYATIAEMFVALLQQPVPKTRALIPELPITIANMLDECLVKQRDRRAPDLQRAVTVLEATAVVVPRYTPSKRWLLAVSALAALLVIAAFALWPQANESHDDITPEVASKVGRTPPEIAPRTELSASTPPAAPPAAASVEAVQTPSIESATKPPNPQKRRAARRAAPEATPTTAPAPASPSTTPRNGIIERLPE